MSIRLRNLASTLQKGLNYHGQNITIYTTQHIMPGHGHSVINQYHIKRGYLREGSKYYKYEELFASYKLVEIVYFLRDLWNEVNGLPLDEDEEWKKIKEERISRMQYVNKAKGEEE